MDRCNTCRKSYPHPLDWGECQSCKDMYEKGYRPVYKNGMKVWSLKKQEA